MCIFTSRQEVSREAKGRKQHFELSPANKKRLDAYLERSNDDPNRVTPRLKIGDVVNLALDAWLSVRTGDAAKAAKNG